MAYIGALVVLVLFSIPFVTIFLLFLILDLQLLAWLCFGLSWLLGKLGSPRGAQKDYHHLQTTLSHLKRLD